LNFFWAVALPLAGSILTVALGAMVRLDFFSRRARDLAKIDIPNEVSEVRTDELEMLVGDEADFMFKNAWKLGFWERRKAVTRRLSETRKWLHLVISNAVLFQEIARFQVEELAESADAEKNDLAVKIMERAGTVHLMAVTCLAKLTILSFLRSVWPLYIPMLADRFQVNGQDLIVWYRQLTKETLALAQERYDDITYSRFIFQLTGLFSVEEAAGLNRI
jgi:hypothetical protein